MRALAFGFVVGLTLSTISACGSPKVSCSSVTCTGCCMADGTCQPGNQNVACGRAGGLCDVCSISASCQAGACVLVGNGGGSGGGAMGGGTGGGDMGGGTGGGATGGGTGGGATGGGTGGGGTMATNQLWLRADLAAMGVVTQVYRQAPAGTASVAFSAATPRVNDFAISDDGTLAVLSYDQQSDTLKAVPTAGGTETTLNVSPSGHQITGPVLSPNKQWVAFQQGNGNSAGFDLFVVPTDASTAAFQVSPPRGVTLNLQPTQWAFSPNSRYLALTGDFTSNGVYELWVYDLMLSTLTPLLTGTQIGTSEGARDLGWSSGNQVLTRAKLMTSPSEIYTCPPAGPCALIAGEAGNGVTTVGAMAVSPDGTTIVFTGDQRLAGVADLYKVPATGGTATRLASDAAASKRVLSGSIVISPNNAYVTFLGNYVNAANLYDLYVLPMTGGSTTALQPLISVVANQDVFAMSFSPASDQLAFRADFAVNGTFEAFRLADFVTPNQTPVVLQGLPNGGNVADVKWTP